jgi:hypothetical protein
VLGDLAGLVEEQRPIRLRQREAARRVRGGAGEAAPLVPEERRFQQLGRHLAEVPDVVVLGISPDEAPRTGVEGDVVPRAPHLIEEGEEMRRLGHRHPRAVEEVVVVQHEVVVEADVDLVVVDLARLHAAGIRPFCSGADIMRPGAVRERRLRRRGLRRLRARR